MKFSGIFAAFILCLALSFANGKSFTDLSKRIINGVDGKAEDIPWQAFISRFNQPREPCSGTIVGDKWILTAGTCVFRDDPKDLTVELGMDDKGSKQDTAYMVKKIITYEGYNDETLDSDLALLELNRNIVKGKKIKSIKLPAQGERISVGSSCVFAGWGIINRVNDADSKLNFPKTIQKMNAKVASFSSCKAQLGKKVNDKTMVCVGGQGSSGCLGDSGGPFACKNKSGEWVLRGIGSWGHDLCDPMKYTVMTRISTFVNWINSKMTK